MQTVEYVELPIAGQKRGILVNPYLVAAVEFLEDGRTNKCFVNVCGHRHKINLSVEEATKLLGWQSLAASPPAAALESVVVNNPIAEDVSVPGGEGIKKKPVRPGDPSNKPSSDVDL